MRFNLPLRLIAYGWIALRRALGRRPNDRPGVHAIAVTPAGKIVLVRLRYAAGWRLPGGGRGEAEDPAAAALRELKEEIGLTAHGAVEPVDAELFIVRDVAYRPSWSLEIEAVTEAALDALPADLAAPARVALARARRQV